MAKRVTKTTTKPKTAAKPKSIELRDVLGAIDSGARDLWKSLTEEQRKDVGFYVLVKYCSSVTNTSRQETELAIFKTNSYLNKHFFEMCKHPELLWYLCCMTGNDDKDIMRHEYIRGISKTSDNKAIKFLEVKYPAMKMSDLKLLAEITTVAELKQMARDQGMSDIDIKKIL